MEEFRELPINKLTESPLNPRRHYDADKIRELAESIKSVGIIEPLVVRTFFRCLPDESPTGNSWWDVFNSRGMKLAHLPSEGEARARALEGGFEIIAGSRRHRAALLVKVEVLPVIIRDLTDEQALEIMVIENNQREDVNALEEAEGYKRLLERKYSLERLAGKIGRSRKYIYDRLKLLQLIAPAKALLLNNEITAGHAILLARLKAEEQNRALNPANREVWNHELLLFAPDDESRQLDARKICSVRELEGWIDQHVRMEKKPPDPMLFPETAATLEAAAEQKGKIVQITHNHYTPLDAKEGNSERIYHSTSWKLADGSGKETKSCEKSVIGIIVVGPDRGKAYRVCVDKECPIHWRPEKKKRDRALAHGKAADNSFERQHEEFQLQQKRDDEKRQNWIKHVDEIIEATIEKLKTAPLKRIAEIFDRNIPQMKRAGALLPKWRWHTPDDILHLAAIGFVIAEINDRWWWEKNLPRLKRLGVDVQAILTPKVQTSAPDDLKLTAREVEGLKSALHSVEGARKRWAKRAKMGLTNDALKSAMAEEFGIRGTHSGPGIISVTYKGGADPAIWIGKNNIGAKDKPTFRGARLIEAVRKLMKIPVPAGAPAGNGAIKKRRVESIDPDSPVAKAIYEFHTGEADG